MTVSRSITLAWATSHYISGRHDGVRVRIDVTCAENIDEEIFAYRMLPTDPTTGAKAAFFSHICSPPDMVEWPKNATDPNSSPQWLRLSFIDVLVRSVAEAEEFIELVKTDVLRLKTTFDTMGTLQDSLTITYGTGCSDDVTPEPDPESSESEAVIVWSSESLQYAPELVPVFAPQSGWQLVNTGASSGIGTPGSRAVITLQPGTSSNVLQIGGFDLSGIAPTAQIIGIAVVLQLRDATDGPTNEASLSSASTADIPAVLSVARLLAGGYTSDNVAVSAEITGPEWDTIELGGISNTWGLPELTSESLQQYGLMLAIGVYVPFDGRASTIEVDGVSLKLWIRNSV